MKYGLYTQLYHRAGSPPSRGAWIEIFRFGKSGDKIEVAPLAGGVD